MTRVRTFFLRDLCGLVAVAAIWCAALVAPIHANAPAYGLSWGVFCGDAPLDGNETHSQHHPCCIPHVLLSTLPGVPGASTEVGFAFRIGLPIPAPANAMSGQTQIRAPPV